LLWLGPTFVLRNQKRKLSRNMAIFLFYTASINLWLFIFNMIPVPPLDGSKVLMGLINSFG
ncbi:MAG TPA: site-2 protease family protein, partial [Nanoarchaeota archaeon]|nr:site-2 protease family protein [Nanoarchaeota archaeon]